MSHTNPFRPTDVADAAAQIAAQVFAVRSHTVAAVAASSSGTTTNVVNGRLTLESGVPVSTTDQTGKTTIYFTPYKGNQIVLWDGSAWTAYTFTETSLALGTLTSGLPYDVFGYVSSGALTLELLAWTSTTARATAVTLQDGRYCKSGDKTRLYLGTFYTTATTTTEDSLTKRFVWNNYNRVGRRLRKSDSTSHTYNGGYRSWNNSTANRFEAVIGLQEEALVVSVTGEVGGVSNVYGITAVGMDSTTVPDAYGYVRGIGVAVDASAGGTVVYSPAVGYHFFQALESSVSTGAPTFVTYFIVGDLIA